MAIFGTKADLDRVSEGAAVFDRERDDQFTAQLLQAREAGLASSAQLLALFELLPKAVLANERAECERIASRLDPRHPRVRQLEAAILELERREGLAQRGRRRLARLAQAVERGGVAFHGFVLDAAGDPLEGLTVRLRSRVLGDHYRATTDVDGYFRVALVSWTEEEEEAATGAEAPGEEAAGAERVGGNVAVVEILDAAGRVTFTDPLELQLDGRAAYREYQLDREDRIPSAANNDTKPKRRPAQKKKGTRRT